MLTSRRWVKRVKEDSEVADIRRLLSLRLGYINNKRKTKQTQKKWLGEPYPQG